MVVSAQSTILLASQPALDLLGYTKGEMKGKSLNLILPPQVVDMHASWIARYISTGEPQGPAAATH